MNIPRALSGRRASARGKRGVEFVARWGLLSIGVSYLLVAGIAMKLAFAGGGESADREGALARIAQTGWGKPVLVLVAIGFAGYAAWRFVLAATGENVEDDDEKHPIKRIGYVARGLFYSGLTFVTLRLAVAGPGGKQTGGNGEERQQASTVFQWPGGQWLIAGAGLGFVAAAIFNVYRAISGSYKDQLKTWEIPKGRERVVTAVTAFGLVSRAAVFGIIGWFLIRTAVDHDPKKAIGLDGALRVMAGESDGRVLLTVVALGLASYAAFRFVEARYRTV